MLLFIQNTDWSSVAKIYGPLGIFCLIAVILVWKGLLPYIKSQHKEHVAALQATIQDARNERDYSRQLREKEVDKFLGSLKLRDEKMEKGFDEIVRALQDTRR